MFVARIGVIGLAIIGLTVSKASADVLVSSTFDTNLGGWTSNTPSQVTWDASGGNPGGFMAYTDATADTTFVYAPLAFFGDYAAENVTAISFDHQIFAEDNVISVAPYKIDLSGPGGTATWLGTTPSLATLPTGWINVSAPIADDPSAPSGWNVTSGTWQGLMADVTGFDIQIELVTNNQVPGWIDNEGIDNVTLTGTAASVPEPGSFALLGSGLLGLARCRRTPSTPKTCAAAV